MSGIIGKKVGMTSIFDSKGDSVPCTVLNCAPNFVSAVKTLERDGYSSVQLAFEDKREKSESKALKGHFKKSELSPKRKVVEFKYFEKPESFELGKKMLVSDVFSVGDIVDVTARSKGKGFQGVVKRHGFSGVGQATHGQHNRLRAPGSIGASSYPSRVFKGMRMAGRMGDERVTVQNLEVFYVDSENHLLVVKGSVPGAKNSYVIIQK